MLRALCCTILGFAAAAAAEVEVPGATRAEWYRALRAHVAAKGDVDEDAVICRLVAAALCQKARPEGEGAVVSAKMAERPWMVWGDFEPVHRAAQAAELPAEFRRLFLAWHGGLFLYPIRQSPPAIGTRGLVAILEDLPADADLVEVGPGTTVADLIAVRWSGWKDATPVQRMLVYEALARANPLILDRGSYRVDAAHPAAVGVRRVAVPTWLEIVQMQRSLYAIDPTLHPLHPHDFDPDADNGEELPVPIGDGQVRVRRFLVPVGGRILVPPGDWLAAAASPDSVELRNAMIADAGVLAGLDPVSLDLAGNDLADLAPLAGMRRLTHLRLDRNPVADLTPLAELSLESLELVGTRVVDLAPLASHPALTRLALDHTGVSDLAPLARLPLREIGLRGTSVVDLEPLFGKDLDYVSLELRVAYDRDQIEALSVERIGDVPRDRWILTHLRQHDPARAAAEVEEREARAAEAKRPKVPDEAPGSGEGKGVEDKDKEVDDALEDLLD